MYLIFPKSMIIPEVAARCEDKALAARIRGDNSAAVKAFATARPEIEKRVVAAPTNAVELSVLAMIDAGLGRKEQAIEEGKRACELTPFKVNNFDAPYGAV